MIEYKPKGILLTASARVCTGLEVRANMCVCLMVSLRKCVYCSQATDVENRYHNCVNEYGTILFTVAAKERRLKSIWYGSFSLVRQKR